MKVYIILGLLVSAFSAGIYVHLFTDLIQNESIHFVFSGLSVGLFLTLRNTPDSGTNGPLRLAMLLGFCFLSGPSMGPALQLVTIMKLGYSFQIAIFASPLFQTVMKMKLGFCLSFLNGLGLGALLKLVMMTSPRIYTNGLLVTDSIFIAFTIAAFMMDGKYLHLGEPLTYGFYSVLGIAFLNVLLKSPLLFQVNLVFVHWGLLIDPIIILYRSKSGLGWLCSVASLLTTPS